MPVSTLSFQEKSAWAQLLGLAIGAAGYGMLAASSAIDASRPGGAVLLFGGVVVLIVTVTILGHILAAITGGEDKPDERDRQIIWRAGSRSAWVMSAVAVLAAIALSLDLPRVWVAHGLMGALFAAEMLRCLLQIVAYRRGF